MDELLRSRRPKKVSCSDEGANAIGGTKGIADACAFGFLFNSDGGADCGERDRRDELFGALGKIEHCIKCGFAITAAREGKIAFRIWCVQAYRERIDDPFELWCDVSLADERPLSVRVDAYGQIGICLEPSGNFFEDFEGLGRFTVATKDDFGKEGKVNLFQCRDDLFSCWFSLEPKRVSAAESIPFIANTERAGTGATVRKIDIETITYAIKYVHRF